MASDEVTGWLEQKVKRKRYEHPEDHEFDFEDFYCLADIPRQPEDYDGPQRVCGQYTKLCDEDAERDRYNRCKFHNGAAHGNWEKGIEDSDQFEEGNGAAITHGAYADDENLKDNWSDADAKIYERVMGWARDYGFEPGSPEYTQLETLAMSKVREMRSEKYLNENGEVVERQSYDPESGQVEEWEEVHELSDNLRLKKKTILDMMKELGLTPKAKSQIGESDSKGNAADALAEVASRALDADDAEYDPDKFE